LPTPITSEEPPPVITLGDALCNGKPASIDDILFVRDVIFGLKTLSAQGRLNLCMAADAPVTIKAILFIRDVIFGSLTEIM